MFLAGFLSRFRMPVRNSLFRAGKILNRGSRCLLKFLSIKGDSCKRSSFLRKEILSGDSSLLTVFSSIPRVKARLAIICCKSAFPYLLAVGGELSFSIADSYITQFFMESQLFSLRHCQKVSWIFYISMIKYFNKNGSSGRRNRSVPKKSKGKNNLANINHLFLLPETGNSWV